MAYVIIESETPRFYSIAMLLDANPSAVLSTPPTAEELAAYNVYELTVQPQPAYNRLTQKVVSAGVADVAGTWTLSWNVVDLTLEEIAANQTPEALSQLIAATQDSVAAVQSEVSEITGPTENQTEADKVFRAIIMSYSIPGSYPEKVAAVDSAVATFGANGSYQDLYDYAVAILL